MTLPFQFSADSLMGNCHAISVLLSPKTLPIYTLNFKWRNLSFVVHDL